jgi:hypothetical protein
MREAMGVPPRLSIPCIHKPPASFKPGASVDIVLEQPPGAGTLEAILRYRRVNQAETYEQLGMRRVNGTFRATVPAAYTASPYPLMYYFVIREGSDRAGLFPGFDEARANQPYFVIRQV